MYLYIKVIKTYKTHLFVNGSIAHLQSVGVRSERGRFESLCRGASSSEVCSKIATFFYKLRTKNCSKSRTKIGVSVDIKVWEKNSDSSQISQKLCGINLILHRYLWEHQNIWEKSTQKIEQNLGKVKTKLSPLIFSHFW